MSLLDRMRSRTLRSAQRKFAPFMDHGETILAVDMCRGGPTLETILSGHGPVVHVALSDKALYMTQRGGHTDRVLIADMAEVKFEPRPDPRDIVQSAAYAAGGAMSRLVSIRLRNDTYVALLPLGRRAVAMFGPELAARVNGP